MRIDRVEEFAIESPVFAQVCDLLQGAFPGYPQDRPYFKLRPHFRYLAWDGETLAGHMGVDHRVIRVGDELLAIFGVIDLCVAPRYQHRSLATQMLRLLEDWARDTQRDAIVLFADDHRVYAANGYQRIETPCTWMMIDDHRTLGITTRSLGDSMMVKPIALARWPDGAVDLLGYLF
jgi:GNAT superfamily N-acetyltransferase